jgi:hypothetical protein
MFESGIRNEELGMPPALPQNKVWVGDNLKLIT